MTATPLIIDTDPGIDDAIAIAMAISDPICDIRLITTTAGNVGIDKTTDNALKLLQFFGSDIPLAAGASTPLVRELTNATSIHGDSGMDGYDFPPPDRSVLLDVPAVEAMRQTLASSEVPVTIICLGPLTNLAMLLRLYPSLTPNIDRVIFMGGSTQRGNKGVLSEYNIHCDPEAADIVLRSGLTIHMIPLDVGWKALIYPKDSAKLANLNETGKMVHGLLKQYRGVGLRNGLKMYDGCAIAYLLRPEIFTTTHVPVVVELDGTYTSGATLVDLRGYLGFEPNATVATDIDAEAFTDLLFTQLARCK